MDRVCHPDSVPAHELQETIEVDVREATPSQASDATATSIAERLRTKQWVVVAVILCSLGVSVGLWQGWSTAQRQLRLDSNARLLSDLRNLSPERHCRHRPWRKPGSPSSRRFPRFQPPWRARLASRSPHCPNWSAWSKSRANGGRPSFSRAPAPATPSSGNKSAAAVGGWWPSRRWGRD